MEKQESEQNKSIAETNQASIYDSLREKFATPLQNKIEDIQSSEIVQKAQGTAVAKHLITPLKDFIIKFTHDWTVSLQAGALAYSFIVAMIPIIIALLALFGWLLGGLGQASQQTLMQSITRVLPHAIAGDVGQAIQDKQIGNATGILSLIALFTAIFGGSRLFVLMEHCFDLIYRQKPRAFIEQNVMAIGMVLLFAILIPITVLASSLPAILIRILNDTLNDLPGKGLLFYTIGTLSSLITSWIFFEAVYIIVPNQHISFKNSWRGAIFSAIAMQFYLTFFPLYVSHFLGGSLGQVGFAIILVVFFYYFALIILIGAHINAFFSEDAEQNTDNNIAQLMPDETTN